MMSSQPPSLEIDEIEEFSDSSDDNADSSPGVVVSGPQDHHQNCHGSATTIATLSSSSSSGSPSSRRHRRFTFLPPGGPSPKKRPLEPPESPQKRLRPLSEIGRFRLPPPPLAANTAAIVSTEVQDPDSLKNELKDISNSSNDNSNNSRCRDQKLVTTPTKTLSALSRALGRISPNNSVSGGAGVQGRDRFSGITIRPPAALGPKLLELAKISSSSSSSTLLTQVVGDEIESTLDADFAQWYGKRPVKKESRSLSSPPPPRPPAPAPSRQIKTSKSKPRAISTPLLSLIKSEEIEATTNPICKDSQAPSSSSPARLPLSPTMLRLFEKAIPLEKCNRIPPPNTGLFTIFALIIAIEPLVEEKSNNNTTISSTNNKKRIYTRVQITVCDHSVTSFRIVLWGDKSRWIESIKAGDVALFTELQMKEYRKRINGNTTSFSTMERLDGSLLTQYRGHEAIERTLRVLNQKRQILALDLLDRESLAQEPSFYVTQMVVPSSDLGFGHDKPEKQVCEKERKSATTTTAPTGAVGVGVHRFERGGSSATPLFRSKYLIKKEVHPPPPPPPLSATATTVRQTTSLSSTSVVTTPSTALPARATTTDMAIHANVVYRMCIRCSSNNENVAGWEIGTVQSNGRFVKVKSTGNPQWIDSIRPDRMFKFYGQFTVVDGEHIFQLAKSLREPMHLGHDTWTKSGKRYDPKVFTTLREIKECQFLGDACIETYLLGVYTPFEPEDSSSFYKEEFIQMYCTSCSTAAVSSPKDPSVWFCPHCHLDPDQREESRLVWSYPRFEITLGDHPPSAHYHHPPLDDEWMQKVRCDLNLGNQLFPTIPAYHWIRNGQTSWFRSRDRWRRLYQLMNHHSTRTHDGDDGEMFKGGEGGHGRSSSRCSSSSGGGDDSVVTTEKEDSSENPPQRVKVFLTVGLNGVSKATRLEYIWS